MKKIEEQIHWYEENANSLYDDMIAIELRKINSLYDGYEDHTDEMFVEEMIESFCKIVERQREKIHDLESEQASCKEGLFDGKPLVHAFTAAQRLRREDVPHDPECELFSADGFQNDKELQAAFTQYCLLNGSSSYTVNDYCSRIKKLWKSFEEDFKSGKLGEDFSAYLPPSFGEGILLNVYDNTELLGKYIREKIAQQEGNRNWLNARAAFNKFDEFRQNSKK